ncbi:MAG: gluconate 2-dehydrogenase subunit 3 family protein [Bacteroidetes bacterium]|nr:gluconate 2-dehydrogenase subunit 3 family protein [Bacteroidota bacterium]MBU1372974.1 gluconate 2-dehydrogenase subunit 3 family protein [Bacteroidota bacterium]MBU1485417.1 gluconate 2-dehydrogenase subunit 3 family protein [Bacteroidota bacterium]MBU1759988.1 gluconate 2-dehydrogenase subunit 3 family protein [Bacteroidota bacterium]MBU2269145.1 gluconate 2-dehydrogenase subunit 3 family protein [Bacteroidota bacterium]
MNRREAISSVALLLGGTIIGGEIFSLAGCKSNPKQVNDLFNTDEVTYMNEIAETIIPATNTPGAKAAKTGEFMAVMVKDCYTPKDQKIFKEGLNTINEKAKSQYGSPFMDLKPDERKKLLSKLDDEQKKYSQNVANKDTHHYFRMMKELTLLGFFTSEIGGTKVLTYVEVPGRYDACIPYKKGDPVYLNP